MKKLLIGLIIFIAGCIGDTNGGSAVENTTNPVPQQKVLAVPYYGQATQVWCWAATEQMLLSFYGAQMGQVDIVTATFGAPLIQTASTQAIQAGLWNLDGIATDVYGPLSFAQIKNLISSNKPLIMGYQGSFSGHVVVLYGYDQNNNVYINDPYYGQFVVPYAYSIVYSAGTPNALVWQSTIVPRVGRAI